LKINRITNLLYHLAIVLPCSISVLAQEPTQAFHNANQLTEPEEVRANEIQPPELVMDILGIRPGMIIGEVGAGHGRLTVHLAARVGDKGKVYANDIDPKAIDYLKARCQRQGIKNVETILSLSVDARFPENTLDLVAMILSWAPVEDPGFLDRIKESIRPGGYIVFEHVIQKPQDPFPPGVHALVPGALRDLFRDFELLIYREVEDYGDWGGPSTPHVRMVARKPQLRQ
jgi:precorrin-6B methylase 2